MSTRTVSWGILVAALVLITSSCEKEEEVTGPTPSTRPDDVVVTVGKPVILSDRRDSTSVSVQLLRAGRAFEDVYVVNMLTDRYGFFLEGRQKKTQITFQTDRSGQASLYFYGSPNPGISLIRTWGEGFGLDTVKVSVIVGIPYFLELKFRDFASTQWAVTDTLKSGVRLSRPDSTLVHVTVFDRDMNPLEGIVVNLIPLVNGLPIRLAQYGYFKTSRNPNQSSNGTGISGADGSVEDTYYSDDLPNLGNPVRVEVVARVDSAQYGRIEGHKFLVIVP